MPAKHFLTFCALVLASSASAQGFMPPEPYGGDQAVKWLFDQELRMSQRDIDAKVDGQVDLSFTIAADGTARNTRIERTLSEDTEAEALRLASLIRWYPASVGGSKLDKEHTLSVPFNAKRYQKAHAKDPAPEAFLAHPADGSLRLFVDKEVDSLAVPLIPKGLRGLPAYFGSNITYPEDARRRDIQGKVAVEFVVETSGIPSNVRTVESLGGGCDEEAMRLVRGIRWKPAYKNGQRVRYVMKIDIQFRLGQNTRP